MFLVADRVKETTQSTGTGAYLLDGAETGFQTFANAIGGGNQTFYHVAFGAGWETGIGTVTGGGTPTLSRDTILSSSNGGSAVNWGVGVKDLGCGMPAARVNTPVRLSKFTSNGTWNNPGVVAVLVEVQAGGGGGGGTAATGAGERAQAAGGGGGAYSKKLIYAAALGSTESIVVGSGGAGGAPGANNGVPGGGSSFGGHVAVDGGTGGTGVNPTTTEQSSVPGNGGAITTGGDVDVPGEHGGRGLVVNGVAFGAGTGGSSHLGRDRQVFHKDTAGTSGGGFGAGGSGAGSQQNDPARAGGDGAPGVVLVWEY